jgi:hypothetical protein
VVRLSSRLTTSVRAVIDSSPFAGLGPIEVARILRVDKTLVSRLMAALRADDSLASLNQLPGAVPIRQFLRAAREHGAKQRAVEAAERELQSFEHELQRTFGTRSRLDAMLADTLPEARRRHQVAARQAVYRGMALVKGSSIDLECITWVVHPSRKSPKQVDILILAGFVGVRRMRPTAQIRLASRHARPHPDAGAKLLKEFCRPADLSIEDSREADFVFYEISSRLLRRDHAADVFLTEFLRGTDPIDHRTDKRRIRVFGDAVGQATKRLMLNILVHQDAWPGCDFSVTAFDTALRGMVDLPNKDRESDRLSLDSEVVRTQATREALRSSPIPNYERILRHLTTEQNWKLEDSRGAATFRMFSVDLLYPLYGAEVLLVRE